MYMYMYMYMYIEKSALAAFGTRQCSMSVNFS